MPERGLEVFTMAETFDDEDFEKEEIEEEEQEEIG